MGNHNFKTSMSSVVPNAEANICIYTYEHKDIDWFCCMLLRIGLVLVSISIVQSKLSILGLYSILRGACGGRGIEPQCAPPPSSSLCFIMFCMFVFFCCFFVFCLFFWLFLLLVNCFFYTSCLFYCVCYVSFYLSHSSSFIFIVIRCLAMLCSRSLVYYSYSSYDPSHFLLRSFFRCILLFKGLIVRFCFIMCCFICVFLLLVLSSSSFGFFFFFFFLVFCLLSFIIRIICSLYGCVSYF